MFNAHAHTRARGVLIEVAAPVIGRLKADYMLRLQIKARLLMIMRGRRGVARGRGRGSTSHICLCIPWANVRSRLCQTLDKLSHSVERGQLAAGPRLYCLSALIRFKCDWVLFYTHTATNTHTHTHLNTQLCFQLNCFATKHQSQMPFIISFRLGQWALLPLSLPLLLPLLLPWQSRV